MTASDALRTLPSPPGLGFMSSSEGVLACDELRAADRSVGVRDCERRHPPLASSQTWVYGVGMRRLFPPALVMVIAGCAGGDSGSQPDAARPTTAAGVSACLASAGFAVKRSTRSPGDSNAPDTELVAHGRNTTAFIGYYSDPGRATRSLPSIKRNARRAHGVVEHRAFVTVLFVSKPSSDAKRRTMTCVS